MRLSIRPRGRLGETNRASRPRGLYEVDKIDFVWPERSAQYCPDFKVVTKDGGFFYVEGKGIFSTEDHHKHLLVKTVSGCVEIRFVFNNNKSKLYRTPRPVTRIGVASMASVCRQNNP